MRALSESCRMVQGSKQTFRCIPSEQRTEPKVGCAGPRPILRDTSAGKKPEQEWYRRGLRAFVSYPKRQGRFLVDR